MNLSHFLTILRARWVSAAAVFFSIVVVVMTASWFFPKNYTATASVLVDVKSPDPVAGVMMHAMTVPSYMATQADLIQSDRVARRAIDLLGLTQNTELRQQWVDATDGVGDYGAWLASALAKNLDVQPSKDSNVLSISFKSRDPNFSSAVANAYVKGYIDTTLELKTEPARQFNTFFDERAKGLRQELEDAQRRLSEFQKSRGIVANDERLDVENMRLAEISSQVVILEAAAVEAASRQTQAGVTPDRMQEVLNNPVVVSLQADLSRQEARLGELTTRLGEANPQVIEARTMIDEMRRKLQTAVQSASGSVSVTSNVAQQRLGQLRAAREEQRAKVLQLKSSRDELAVLEREVANAQRSYDAVMSRANQTSLESQVTQTNVSVVKQATPPPKPSSPNLVLNGLLALIGGALLAVGVALLRELMDPRLRTVEDVTQVLKLPMLLVMPRTSDSSRRLADSTRQARQRLGDSALPAVAAR